jgi:hypothetical protein
MSTRGSEEKRREWAEKVHAQKVSGLSIEGWCRENQIKPSVFHYWKGVLSSRPPITRSSFTEIPLTADAAISIEFCKCHIRLSHFEPSILRSCLSILREVLC